MRAGPMRARVKFARLSGKENVGGVVKGGWLPLCGPFPAEKRPIRGFEQAAEARVKKIELCEFRLRGCGDLLDVDGDDRLVDARDPDRFYDILSVENPDQRGRELIFTCQRGRGDG